MSGPVNLEYSSEPIRETQQGMQFTTVKAVHREYRASLLPTPSSRLRPEYRKHLSHNSQRNMNVVGNLRRENCGS